jgi:hypothetical protein
MEVCRTAGVATPGLGGGGSVRLLCPAINQAALTLLCSVLHCTALFQYSNIIAAAHAGGHEAGKAGGGRRGRARRGEAAAHGQQVKGCCMLCTRLSGPPIVKHVLAAPSDNQCQARLPAAANCASRALPPSHSCGIGD